MARVVSSKNFRLLFKGWQIIFNFAAIDAHYTCARDWRICMSLLDLFKKKGSGDVAKDRLKLVISFGPCELFARSHGND